METETSIEDPNLEPARDCHEALSLGIGFLMTKNIDLTQYKLISAENLIKGTDYIRPHIWRLTFKLKRLIPETSEAEIGAGGELFLEVDLATKTARFLGYGE